MPEEKLLTFPMDPVVVDAIREPYEEFIQMLRERHLIDQQDLAHLRTAQRARALQVCREYEIVLTRREQR